MKLAFKRISSRVVNSAEGKQNFLKPDFRLSRLIEFGNLMVQEQQRVQNSTLVEEYNAGRLNNYQQTPNPAPATPIPNQVANNSTKVENNLQSQLR